MLAAGLAVASQHRNHQWARLMLLKDPIQPVSRDEIVAGRWMGFDADAVAIARASDEERTAARAVRALTFGIASKLTIISDPSGIGPILSRSCTD